MTSEGFELFNKREFVCAVKTVGEINITEEYRSLYYLRKETINCIFVKGVFDNNKCVMNFDVIFAN